MHCITWHMVRNLTIIENETNTVGPGKCRENCQTRKMRKSQGRTWKMLRNTEIVQNEKHTLQDLGYGEKTDKGGKYDTYTVGPGKWRETVKT